MPTTSNSLSPDDPSYALAPAFQPARQLLIDHPHLKPPVIHGLLRRGETMNLIANSKTGKSWLVIALALSIVTGRPWLGRFMVEPGDVLILDNELHRETTANRLPKVAEALGISADEWVDHLFVDNLRGRLADVVRLGAYFDQIEPGRFKIIVLDAFYRFLPAGVDENDNGAIANLYNHLDRFAARLGCAFVLIHHSSKGNQSEKTVTDVGAGAGAQSRAADTHLILRAHEEDGVVVMDAATRSWPPLDPVCLRWSFPIWTIDESLDPTKLRKASSRRQSKAPPEQPIKLPVPEWTVERFATDFLTTQPQDKKLVTAKARSSGLSTRRIEDLLAVAKADGRVHRWTFAPSKTVYLATTPQPITATNLNP